MLEIVASRENSKHIPALNEMTYVMNSAYSLVELMFVAFKRHADRRNNE